MYRKNSWLLGWASQTEKAQCNLCVCNDGRECYFHRLPSSCYEFIYLFFLLWAVNSCLLKLWHLQFASVLFSILFYSLFVCIMKRSAGLQDLMQNNLRETKRPTSHSVCRVWFIAFHRAKARWSFKKCPLIEINQEHLNY